MTLIQKTSGSTTGGVSSVNPALTSVASGNALLLIFGGGGGTVTDTTPTDSSGQTWSKANYGTGTGLAQAQIGIYYLLSANSGTHTLTWNGPNNGFTNYTLLEYSALSAIDQTGSPLLTNGNPTTVTSTAITTGSANTAVFSAMCVNCWNGQTNQGISDPCTGGPGSYTSINAVQTTLTNVGSEWSYQEVTSTSTTISGTWAQNADATANDTESLTVSFVRSAAGAAYIPPIDILMPVQQPSSFVPMMTHAVTTILVAAAGVYVPSGAHAAQQAQVAYREQTRLIQPRPPTITAGTTAISLPVGTQSPLQSQIAYREAARLIQPAPPVITQQGVSVVPPTAVPVPLPTPWPYAAASEFTVIPTTIGITPPYALSPVLTPVREPEWPYAATIKFPGPATTGITPPYALSPVLVPVRQPEWPYAATLLPAPTASEWAQPAPAYLGPPPIAQPPAAAWPYASAVALEAQPAATQPTVSQTPYQPLPQLAQQTWPYARMQPTVDLQDIGVLIGPQAPPTPVLQWLNQPPWPWAATMLGAPTASRWTVTLGIPPSTVLVPVRQPEWPYVGTLLPEPTASQFNAGPPAYFGLSPTQQWLSYPPWPYVGSMLPQPTASEWGVAPVPPVVPPGSNGLRRWAIQRYEAYFTFKEEEQAKLVKDKVERDKPQLPKKMRRLAPEEPVARDDDLNAAFRLVQQISAGSINLDARLTTLEQAKALALPQISKVPTPSVQQVADQDEDDLLLLAILYGDSIWQKQILK